MKINAFMCEDITLLSLFNAELIIAISQIYAWIESIAILNSAIINFSNFFNTTKRDFKILKVFLQISTKEAWLDVFVLQNSSRIVEQWGFGKNRHYQTFLKHHRIAIFNSANYDFFCQSQYLIPQFANFLGPQSQY